MRSISRRSPITTKWPRSASTPPCQSGSGCGNPFKNESRHCAKRSRGLCVERSVSLVAEYHAIGRDLLQFETGDHVIALPQYPVVDADQAGPRVAHVGMS